MDVKLPNLGEGADSGTVVSLFVKEGDKIEKDQPLMELENEKAVATVPSTASGVVSKIHVKAGDKISVGARILTVTEGAGSAAPAAAPAATSKDEKRPAAKPRVGQPVPELPEDDEPIEAADVGESNGEVAAAPSIRRMATDLGIDLTRVRGSARGGRIVLEDVRNYIQKLMRAAQAPKAAAGAPAADKPAPEKIDFSKFGEISKKPMTSLRKIISRRMVENWNAIPHVTQFDDVDLTTILDLRKKYLADYEKQGARLTVTSFVLKGIIAALKKHPIFNSSIDEAAEEIVFKEYYHIGIAVDTEAGLIVPVIRDVDKKSLLQISKDLDDLAKKARDRKVSGDDLKGGSFTISNQGGIGGAHFTPIVNKPEVAILGMGKGAFKAVVRNKVIEARMMLPIGLSYDHRVIDGGEAARFTVDLLQALENFNEADVKNGLGA
jgi:pyruvate dehydrogenase E2 component (dihydrolipoamide acetyltransferase)